MELNELIQGYSSKSLFNIPGTVCIESVLTTCSDERALLNADIWCHQHFLEAFATTFTNNRPDAN